MTDKPFICSACKEETYLDNVAFVEDNSPRVVVCLPCYELAEKADASDFHLWRAKREGMPALSVAKSKCIYCANVLALTEFWLEFGRRANNTRYEEGICTKCHEVQLAPHDNGMSADDEIMEER